MDDVERVQKIGIVRIRIGSKEAGKYGFMTSGRQKQKDRDYYQRCEVLLAIQVCLRIPSHGTSFATSRASHPAAEPVPPPPARPAGAVAKKWLPPLGRPLQAGTVCPPQPSHHDWHGLGLFPQGPQSGRLYFFDICWKYSLPHELPRKSTFLNTASPELITGRQFPCTSGGGTATRW